LPKWEGGLGLQSLDVFNIALMTTHIWNIISNKESLWVRLIHTYKIRNRPFWSLPFKNDVSWGWLKLLQLRELVRPLCWVNLAPNLEVHMHDTYRWRDLNGLFLEFSVRQAWEALRPRGNEVHWFRIVWFSHVIPRHSFHLWLTMRNSLKTQDKLRQWDVGVNTDLSLLRCPLCNTQQDSHAYLFFECIEHNNRLFKRSKRTPEDLKDAIMITVRLKLLSFRFKNKATVRELLDRWKMPKAFRVGKTGKCLSFNVIHLGHVSLDLVVVQARA
ncbi:homeodomain-like protein, partial [Tanacetum coccineum]